MSGAAAITSFLPMLMVAAMRRAEARICRQLTEAGAVTAETAILLTPGRSIDRRRLAGLIQGGAVRMTADSRHFLDADGWSRYQGERRRRALLALTVVVALIGVTVAVVLLWK